jgi:hypothetical protein
MSGTSATPAMEEAPRAPTGTNSHSNGTIRSGTISRHVREGALSQIDAEDSSNYVTAISNAAPDEATDTATSTNDSSPEKFNQWRQTMEGLLDGQGIEEDLHRELGLSAASLSISAKDDREIPSMATKVFPADLGRGSSFKRPMPEESGTLRTLNMPFADADATKQDAAKSRSQSSLQPVANAIALSRPLSLHVSPTKTIELPSSRVSSRVSLDERVISPSADINELDMQGKTLAEEMFEGDETRVKKEKIAEFIGDR